MKKIARGKRKSGSFYYLINSRYISRYLVSFIIFIGIQNPNVLTVFSFLLIILSSFLMFVVGKDIFLNRIIIALIIELSFLFNCAKGQLARKLEKTSMFSKWLGRYFNRIGEMILYFAIGYVTWFIYGHFYYFVFGLTIGYLFTFNTLIYSIRDWVIYKEIEANGFSFKSSNNKNNINKYKIIGKKLIKNKKLFKLLSIIFFYLNVGIGERYLYPIFFILLNRTDIMLIMLLPLTIIRNVNVFLINMKKIETNRVNVV